MLQLILGKTGYGKSEYIKNLARELAKEKEVILLVPDQMSFDTEQDILTSCKADIGANIKVYTFSRLSEDVFKHYGGISEKRLDDKGRSLLMSLAIDDCKDKLKLYANASKSGNLMNLMLEIIKEFKSCEISPTQLFELSKTLNSGLQEKLYEVALVYESFCARLEKTYIEPWDILTRTGKTLRENNYFNNKILLIDGFESFNKQKLNILETAIIQCEKVFCTLCCKEIYDLHANSIFNATAQTGRSLVAIAKENNVAVASFIKLSQPQRFVSTSLIDLEERFFATEEVSNPETCENIQIYKAEDIYKEIEYVAATIRNLVISGYKYGDINVITRSDAGYNNILESIFERYEIPAFVSRPRAVDSSSLIRFVSNVLKIALFGFNTETMLNLAKSGICGITTQEISKLENYVYMWKINYSQWKNEFTKSPEGFGSEFNQEDLMQLEFNRTRLVKPIESFIEKTKNVSGIKICEEIYYLLEKYDCQKYILENSKKLEEQGFLEEAQEQIRIWTELMETLNQFAIIIGENPMSIKTFSKLLQDVFSKEEVMNIPLRLDTVVFGTADNIKRQSKITFLMGCVQDQFPKLPNINGFFTGQERKSLEENSIILERNIDDEILMERFFAYCAACSASEKLFISYPSAKESTDLNPSEIVTRIENIFNIKAVNDLPNSYFACTKASAISTVARIYNQNTAESASLKEYLNQEEELQNKLLAIQRTAKNQDLIIKNNENAKKIFNTKNFSPSQIDIYYRCKFRYFCQYGISAKEKKIAEINVLEYGTIMHYVFEKVLQNKNYYKELSSIDLAKAIEKLIMCYANDSMGGYDNLSYRDRYRLTRVCKTAVVIVQRLMEELAQSKFEPKNLELKLDKKSEFPPLKIQTENGENIYVGGIIDRVDIYEKDEKKYVRIVDYKTGTKVFKLADVLKGLSLQMLIYLCALSENGLVPAGALYMPSAFPEVSASRDMTLEKINDEKSKKMCMSGFVMEDIEIIKAMEENVAGKYVPIRLKKDSQYSSKDNMLNKGQLEVVFEYMKKMISTMATELSSGNVKAEPLLINQDPCSYCPYISVCFKEEREIIKEKKTKDEAFGEIEDLLKKEVE